jgi:putative lipoic acid-binding regulatory protein
MLPDDAKPEITYPCRWSYRIVGLSEAGVRALLLEVLGEGEHTIDGVRPSSKGSYVAVNISVEVRDEAQRTRIYDQLLASEIVKVVL